MPLVIYLYNEIVLEWHITLYMVDNTHIDSKVQNARFPVLGDFKEQVTINFNAIVFLLRFMVIP